jgi:hypothetical protein
MTRAGIKLGDRLYPVARTAHAPAICYRAEPAPVTVVGFGLGALVDVADSAGARHSIDPADLARYLPQTPMGRASSSRSSTGNRAEPGGIPDENALF